MKRRFILILAAALIAFAGSGFSSAYTAALPESTEQQAASAQTYAETLFDTSYVHEINIEISDEDWNRIITNPLDKPKAYVTATIDGHAYENVRFSPKGNASLFLVAAHKSQRFSFKLKFSSSDESQSYHGLDQFVLNNSFEDASYLRDYACAWLFQQQGIPTSLMSFTKLYINGELYGLYMAAETEGESFVERAYGGEGHLYKPSSEVLEQRDGGFIYGVRAALADGTIDEYMENASLDPLAPDYTTPGADLKYTDDQSESYTDIISNEVTYIDGEAVEDLITALKNLSAGNYEEAIDKAEVIRYFAVHNFVGNSDSYTSTMLHNYMLYENNGILSMVPWDYNVSMMPKRTITGDTDETDWTDLINMGIDSPTYEEVAVSDRPMLSWIYEDEAAYAEYEDSLRDIVECVQSGAFEEEMQRLYGQIRPYVAEDPTAFCTPEEFDASYSDVIRFCKLRAESISRQLDGTLSRVTAEQEKEEQVQWN